MTFDVVREIGLALADVEDSTMYGGLALKVRGKLLACLAIHKSAEPGGASLHPDPKRTKNHRAPPLQETTGRRHAGNGIRVKPEDHF